MTVLLESYLGSKVSNYRAFLQVGAKTSEKNGSSWVAVKHSYLRSYKFSKEI